MDDDNVYVLEQPRFRVRNRKLPNEPCEVTILGGTDTNLSRVLSPDVDGLQGIAYILANAPAHGGPPFNYDAIRKRTTEVPVPTLALEEFWKWLVLNERYGIKFRTTNETLQYYCSRAIELM